MRILFKRSSFWRKLLSYRSLRRRRGHGVHSPFVFNLITKVIKEKRAYYCYNDIDLIRKQWLHRDDRITYPSPKHAHKLQTTTVSRLIRQEAIPNKRGQILFRLANSFHPVRILHIGTALDLAVLYTNAYAKGLQVYALEREPAFAPLAQQLYAQACRNPIHLRVGDYQELLPPLLEEMQSVDFVFFNITNEQNLPDCLFTLCKRYATEDTVFIWNNWRASRAMRACWKSVCLDPDVTVTMDLHSLGIAFMNKKLHKRNYKVY